MWWMVIAFFEGFISGAAVEAGRQVVSGCCEPQPQQVDYQEQEQFQIWIQQREEEKRLERNRKQRERRARNKALRNGNGEICVVRGTGKRMLR